MTKMLTVGGAALGASIVLGLVACNGETGPRRVPPPSNSAPRLGEDGRYFGYIRSATEDPPTISFDVAETFSGEAANRAAAEDGVIPQGGSVPNDHYERNPDERTRTLAVSRDAWTPKGPCCRHQTRAELGEFLAAFSGSRRTNLSSDYRGAHSQYWVTIRDGVVVRIDEQYFP